MTTILAAAGPEGDTTQIDMTIVGNLIQHDLDFKLRLIPDINAMKGLKNGYIDIGYSGALFPMRLEANNPEEADSYGGPFQIRIFGSSHFMAAAPAVRADSPIQTIYDITPETTWSTMTGSLGLFEQGILSWIGIDPYSLPQVNALSEAIPKSITHKHWEMSFQSLLNGEAEIHFADAVTPWVRAVSSKSPVIRFLDLPATTDTEGAARFHKIVPFGKLTASPRETAAEIWDKTCFLGTATLWCRDDLDTELAYTITKWFDQNYPRFKYEGAKLLSYTRASFREALDVAMAPVHDGTIKYFDEIGLWTETDDRRQKYNKTIVDWYCRLWDESIEAAKEKGISVDGHNPEWVDIWSKKKVESSIPKIKQMSDREIEGALSQFGFVQD